MSCRHDLYEPNLEGPGAVPRPPPKAARTVVALVDGRFAVAVVQEGVAGYAVDATKTAKTWHAAQHMADADNEAAGVPRDEAWRIATSSMEASRVAGVRWGPNG